MGKHATEISPNQASKIGFVRSDLAYAPSKPCWSYEIVSQAVFLHQVSFTVSYNLIFVTILALYVRIFKNTWVLKASVYLGILVTVFVWVHMAVVIFQCTPVKYFWDKTIPGGHCIKQNESYFVDSTIAMVFVLVIVFLPIPMLWNLQMPLGKKIRCTLAFLWEHCRLF